MSKMTERIVREMKDSRSVRERLKEGNEIYRQNGNRALREDTALNGQHPCAVIICCSDSRVIPEQIFSADIGELFVIRVAGNVLGPHQLGSIEYAVAHLGCKLVVMLGHTGCGAVSAALSGHGDGFISFIVDDILKAVGQERDPDRACRMNVMHGVATIRQTFADHPEMDGMAVKGAVYDIMTGVVEWLED